MIRWLDNRLFLSKYSLFLSIGWIALTCGQASQAAKGPEVVIKSLRNPGRVLILGEFTKGSVKKELDLGDDWDGILEVRGASSSLDLKVDMQYETSLTINDEGAHLDLLNWMHYRSDWISLPPKTSNEFEIRELSRESASIFPFVSKDKFMAAVKVATRDRQNGAKWLRLAGQCLGPLTTPCHVGVSKVVLRIFEKEKPLQEITLVPPLGC